MTITASNSQTRLQSPLKGGQSAEGKGPKQKPLSYEMSLKIFKLNYQSEENFKANNM